MYDRECQACHVVTLDHWETINASSPACETCGGETQRVYTQHTSAVIADDIPGGMEVRNGLCNSDGSPRRYYSKSEMAREAKARGLVNHVVHLGTKGGDRSKHTSRWI